MMRTSLQALMSCTVLAGIMLASAGYAVGTMVPAASAAPAAAAAAMPTLGGTPQPAGSGFTQSADTAKTSADVAAKAEQAKKDKAACEAPKSAAPAGPDQAADQAASRAAAAAKCKTAAVNTPTPAGTAQPTETARAKTPDGKTFASEMFSKETAKLDNVWHETDIKKINTLKTTAAPIDPAKLATLQTGKSPTAATPATIGGIQAAVKKTTVVANTQRTLSPNTFVSPRTSTVESLQDYTQATRADDYNVLTVNTKGEEGWYAMNQKTNTRDFVPISALEKGVALGQNPANSKGGYGDYRAAAGNLQAHAHQGNDWMNDKGEGVYSTINGKVINIGEGTGNIGNRVTIKSDDGTITQLTGHMSNFNPDLKVGDTVKAGDYIGDIGNSGAKWSDPHLHIELRNSTGSAGIGSPMDPTKVTASMYGNTSNLSNWMNGSSAGGFGSSLGATSNAVDPNAIVSSIGGNNGGNGGNGGGNMLSGLLGGGGMGGNPLAMLGSMGGGSSGSGNTANGMNTTNSGVQQVATNTAEDKKKAAEQLLRTQRLAALCGEALPKSDDALMLMLSRCKPLNTVDEPEVVAAADETAASDDTAGATDDVSSEPIKD